MNNVVVERTVAEVMPAVKTNRDQIVTMMNGQGTQLAGEAEGGGRDLEQVPHLLDARPAQQPAGRPGGRASGAARRAHLARR